MTNTELAILAHRAGFGEKTENSIRIEEFAKLKKFADLVAQHEREANAKVCDDLDLEYAAETIRFRVNA
jgi:hypothetical protein